MSLSQSEDMIMAVFFRKYSRDVILGWGWQNGRRGGKAAADKGLLANWIRLEDGAKRSHELKEVIMMVIRVVAIESAEGVLCL